MKSARKFVVVLVTTPDLKTARALAKAILEKRLAACANLVPKIESHYWWQGKLEQGNEVLMVIKTTRTKLSVLEKCVLANHPYDTPEILSFALDQGTQRYCQWLLDSVENHE